MITVHAFCTGLSSDADGEEWPDFEEDYEEHFATAEEALDWIHHLEDQFDFVETEVTSDGEDGDGDDLGGTDNIGDDLDFEEDYGLGEEWSDEAKAA